MWKDVALYGASSVLNYFYTKQMCDDHEIMVMLSLNLMINLVTMCTVLLKNPIKVVDNRVDLK
jgi:hypothetical protein